MDEEQLFPTNERLDVALVRAYPEHSRSTWQKYIKAGNISVNDEVVTIPKALVRIDQDTISVHVPEKLDHSEQQLPILYIDDNVIVIEKPVGILTHSKGALNDEFTVADFLRQFTTYGLDGTRPGIVHRLDRDTSGVMIGARTPEAATHLQKQFANRTTKKTYLAIISGVPKKTTARIELPIGRNPKAPSTFRVDPKGKEAVTDYNVLLSEKGKTLIGLMPATGRTHQLRVHMQYIGHPIVGDKVYGTPAERMYLHALSLEVTLPTGVRQIFSTQIPEDFRNVFKQGDL